MRKIIIQTAQQTLTSFTQDSDTVDSLLIENFWKSLGLNPEDVWSSCVVECDEWEFLLEPAEREMTQALNQIARQFQDLVTPPES